MKGDVRYGREKRECDGSCGTGDKRTGRGRIVAPGITGVGCYQLTLPLIDEEPWRSNGIRKTAVGNYLNWLSLS